VPECQASPEIQNRLGHRTLCGLFAGEICDTLFFGNKDLNHSGKVGIGMERITLAAVLHREEDLYVAECPQVGTVSQGYTVDEALDNLKEATELYLEEFPLPSIGKPLLTTFEIAVSGAVHA